jgi:hypothetical protein
VAAGGPPAPASAPALQHTHSGEEQCFGSGYGLDPDFNPVSGSSVADPEGSETFGRIRSGTEINVSDPDSNPEVLLAEAGRPLGGRRHRQVLQPCNTWCSV